MAMKKIQQNHCEAERKLPNKHRDSQAENIRQEIV